MSIMMDRPAYEQMIQEDIDWLMKQPRTLERDHVVEVLKASTDRIYGKEPVNVPKCGNHKDVPFGVVRIGCEYDKAGFCVHCGEEIPF